MKTITFILLLAVCALPTYSQNITNTLGTGGTFTIKDASKNYLTLSQSTGQVNILSILRLENTTSSSSGILFKGTNRFLHDYQASGTNGCNTFLGINSGNFTMSGTGNSASYNTGFGNSSLTSLTNGQYNTAVGYASLYSNTYGFENTAVGSASLNANTGGYDNTAVGDSSLSSNTTGMRNTAEGEGSLHSNTAGSWNTAVGYHSLYSNTTNLAYDNTAVGEGSLYSNTTGYENTAIGDESLISNLTGNWNTALGSSSLAKNTNGTSNTAVGYESLFSNTGSSNTAVGRYAGYSITTGTNNTLIGYSAQASTATISNEITLGNSSVGTLRCAVQAISTLSDARDKKNIHDLSLGIDFLMRIKPRLFNWDKREWYKDNKSDGSKMQKTPTAGFIAQELDEAQTKENAEWLNLILKDNPDKLEATPGNLLPVMVKAIQELKNSNDQLKEKNEKLEEKLIKFEQTQTVLANEIEKLKSLKEK